MRMTLFVLQMILQCGLMSLAFGEERELARAKTSVGEVIFVRDVNASSCQAILDGKRFAFPRGDQCDMLMSVRGVYHVPPGDVVLAASNCGGNACAWDNLFFVVVSSDRSIRVTETIGTDGEHEAKVTVEGGRVTIQVPKEGAVDDVFYFENGKVSKGTPALKAGCSESDREKRKDWVCDCEPAAIGQWLIEPIKPSAKFRLSFTEKLGQFPSVVDAEIVGPAQGVLRSIAKKRGPDVPQDEWMVLRFPDDFPGAKPLSPGKYRVIWRSLGKKLFCDQFTVK